MTRHAATTDPTTSHEAARKAEESGLVKSDSEMLLWLLQKHPGSTIPELAEKWYDLNESCPTEEWSFAVEYYRQRLGRRTGDLLKAGLAYPKGKRDGCQCWFPGKEPAQPGEGEQRALFEPEPRPWVTD